MIVQRFSTSQVAATFVNGSLIAATSGLTLTTNTQPLYFGVNNDSSYWLDGKLDEVRLHNYSMTTDAISTIWNNENDPLSFFIVGSEDNGTPTPTPTNTPTPSPTPLPGNFRFEGVKMEVVKID